MALTEQAIADLNSRLPSISIKVGCRSNQEIYQALIAAGIQVDAFVKRTLLESDDLQEETEIQVGVFSGYDFGFTYPASRAEIYLTATESCGFELLELPHIAEIGIELDQLSGKWLLIGMDAIFDIEKEIERIIAIEKNYLGQRLLRPAVGTSTRLWKPSVEWMFGLP